MDKRDNVTCRPVSLLSEEVARRFAQFSADYAAEAIFWINSDASIIYANQQACNSLGYSCSDIVKLKVFDVDPKYEKKNWPIHWKKLKEKGSFVIESKHRRKDGTEFPVSILINYLEFEGNEYHIAYARDISERKMAEDILRASEENYRTIYNAANDAIFVHDIETGRILDANQTMLDMYGFDSVEDVRELSIGDISSTEEPYTQAKALERIYKATTEGPQLFEWVGKKKNGNLFWLEVNLKRKVLGGVPRIIAVVRDISKRKEAEAKAAATEKRFQNLFNNFTNPISLYDLEGKIILVNKYGANNLGGNPEDFVGKSIYKLFPGHKKVFKERINRIVETGSGFEVEDQFEFHGSKVWYYSNIQPLKDANGKIYAVQSISYDMTKIKLVEKALSESEEKYRRLFESASDAIIVADAESGIILDANFMSEQLLGKPIDKIIGMHQSEIHPYETRAYYKKMFSEDIANNGAQQSVGYVLGKNDQVIPVSISASIYELKDRKVIIGIFRDITELKQVEESLRKDKNGLKKSVSEKNEALRWALKELEDAKRLSDIGALAGTVAHELRNPLGVINTALYNIKRKRKETSIDSHIDNISKKVVESDRIIQNLLTFSTIRVPHFEQIFVLSFVEECLSICRRKYEKLNANVIRKFNCNKNCSFQADSTQMFELFLNILDNAYQSLQEKGGKIEIQIDYLKKDNFLIISVNDNGVGIDPEDQKKIFEPFFTRKSRGVGLGLTVCRQVVNLHGGSLYFDSKKGVGTKVTVKLPIARV